MRIGINTVGIAPGWGGAEETFLRHLLQELSRFDASAAVVVFTDPENHTSFPSNERHEVSGSAIEKAVSRAGVDVLLTSVMRLPSRVSCPVLPYATHPPFLSGSGGGRGLFGSSPAKTLKSRLANVPVLLATSKYVQQELLTLGEVPLNKTVIAHLGVSTVFGEPYQSILDPPYVLTVGNTNGWKRTKTLLDAFRRVQDEVDFSIAVVGRPGDAEEESWGDRVFRIDRIPERHLAGLYQQCEAFVRMAPNDGTGITILEAMASGAVVLTPRSGAPGELGGNAPIYYNSDSLDSLVGVLRRVNSMPQDERERRAALGRQTAQGYSWERCAGQVLKALRRAVESS